MRAALVGRVETEAMATGASKHADEHDGEDERKDAEPCCGTSYNSYLQLLCHDILKLNERRIRIRERNYITKKASFFLDAFLPRVLVIRVGLVEGCKASDGEDNNDDAECNPDLLTFALVELENAWIII